MPEIAAGPISPARYLLFRSWFLNLESNVINNLIMISFCLACVRDRASKRMADWSLKRSRTARLVRAMLTVDPARKRRGSRNGLSGASKGGGPEPIHTGLWKMDSGRAAGRRPRNDGFACLQSNHRCHNLHGN